MGSQEGVIWDLKGQLQDLNRFFRGIFAAGFRGWRNRDLLRSQIEDPDCKELVIEPKGIGPVQKGGLEALPATLRLADHPRGKRKGSEAVRVLRPWPRLSREKERNPGPQGSSFGPDALILSIEGIPSWDLS